MSNPQIVQSSKAADETLALHRVRQASAKIKSAIKDLQGANLIYTNAGDVTRAMDCIELINTTLTASHQLQSKIIEMQSN